MSCPICGEKGVEKYRPFCSKRCADIDLGRWMTGSYAVPSEREYDPEEAARALDETLSDDAKQGDGNGSGTPH